MLFFVSFLCLTSYADAKDKTQLSGKNLAGLFITELFKNGNFEIKNQPDECVSKARPLTLFKEFSELFILSVKESENIKINARCEKTKDAKSPYFCRLYFFSSNKNSEWSLGFNFIGNPDTGEIDLNSLVCFNT